MFVKSFHYFRGIAILIIVAGHSLHFARPNLLEKFIINLKSGGTSLFVFISGFLFYHIFYKNFHYQRFMIQKVRNVLLPYLLLSILPVCSYVFLEKTGPVAEFFFIPGSGVYPEYIRPLVFYLLTGQAFLAYWYIPFIMLIFALSPVFVRYIALSFPWRATIMLLLLCVSTVIHRPVNNINVLQSVVYFLPVYLLGIMASMHREKIYDYFGGKEIYFMLAAVFLALFQGAFYEISGNFHKHPFAVTVIDLIIIQKIFLCLFFIVWLHRFEQREFPLLEKLADASFAVYFLHIPVIIIVHKTLKYLYLHHYTPFNVEAFLLRPWCFVLYFPLILFITMVLALCIKRVSGRYSRQILGW